MAYTQDVATESIEIVLQHQFRMYYQSDDCSGQAVADTRTNMFNYMTYFDGQTLVRGASLEERFLYNSTRSTSKYGEEKMSAKLSEL